MIPAYRRKCMQVDDLLKKAECLTDDQFLVANICGYACVLLSGVLELVLKETIGTFAKRKAHEEVSAIAIAYLEQIQNPKPEKIQELFGLFRPLRDERLNSFWDDEVKDAIGSIVGNRHLIAHGRDTNISLVRIKAWNNCCQKFCEFMATEFST